MTYHTSVLSWLLLMLFPFYSFSQIVITDNDLQGGESYTWTSDNAYTVDGFVFLEEGGSLTIEAGTVVKFTQNSEVPSSLVISRGAKVFINGEECNPVIFTAEADDMGNSNDLTSDDRGLWGGFAVLGAAGIGDACQSYYTNIFVEEDRAAYGGPSCNFNDEDNSGSIKYLSIRHAGADLNDGFDFPAFFLGGVGSGTTIDYVETFASNDDGVKINGGTVNLKHISSSFSSDESFEVKQGWRGSGQFWFAIQGNELADNGMDHTGSFELGNTDPTIYNTTLIGAGIDAPNTSQADGFALNYYNNSAGDHLNSIFIEFAGDFLSLEDDNSVDNFLQQQLQLRNNIIWRFGGGTSPEELVNVPTEFQNIITDLFGQYENEIIDPLLVNTSLQQGKIDPRPSVEGPAYSNRADYPDDDFFETNIKYRGAFGTDIWLWNWTALDETSIIVPNTSCENFAVDFTKEDVSCYQESDGGIGLIATGGTPPYDYDWDIDQYDGQAIISGLPAGTYSVTISDDNCCSTALDIFIGEPSAFSIGSCEEIEPNIPAGNNGIARITFEGGVYPYEVIWDGPTEGSDTYTGAGNGDSGGSLDIFNLSTGEYFLVASDGNGCVSECSFFIEGPECDLDVSANVTPISCAGESDGKIDLVFGGGTPPLTFDWNINALDGQENPENLGPGEYSVTVTDSLGCTASTSVFLEDPEELSISVEIVEHDKSEDDDTGVVNVTVSGGNAPYTINWTGSEFGSQTTGGESNTIQLEEMNAGGYLFAVEDESGCTASVRDTIDSIFVVEEDDDFVVEITGDITPQEMEDFKKGIEEQGGVLQKECNCEGDGIPRVQLWHADREIEINSSPPEAQSKTESDTSGLGKQLLLGPIDVSDDENKKCITGPGIGPKEHSVNIAVIDSGIDLKTDKNPNGHLLLDSLNWVNPDDIENNKDEDENCITDDLFGYDYVTESPLVIDSIGHGTHLAGIIANGYPEDIDLNLMNVKVFGEKGGTVFDLICAIHYAVNEGAQVINLSLGYFNARPSKPLFSAFKKAEAKGVLMVVSAGNDTLDLTEGLKFPELLRWPGGFKHFSQDTLFYPLNNLLVVASLNREETDLDTAYSNYGEGMVDLATKAVFKSTHLDQKEMTLKGTSMSAAYVSRLASLALAYDPDLDIQDMINCMQTMVDSIELGSELSGIGKLNENLFLICMGLEEESIFKSPVPPPPKSGGIKYSSLNVNETIIMTLGDGNTFYDNVRLVVTDGLKDIFKGYYCSANQIIWDGTDQNGYPVDPGPYFVKVYVGSMSFNAQKVVK